MVVVVPATTWASGDRPLAAATALAERPVAWAMPHSVSPAATVGTAPSAGAAGGGAGAGRARQRGGGRRRGGGCEACGMAYRGGRARATPAAEFRRPASPPAPPPDGPR